MAGVKKGEKHGASERVARYLGKQSKNELNRSVGLGKGKTIEGWGTQPPTGTASTALKLKKAQSVARDGVNKAYGFKKGKK